jgi:hypothetical protein
MMSAEFLASMNRLTQSNGELLTVENSTQILRALGPDAERAGFDFKGKYLGRIAHGFYATSATITHVEVATFNEEFDAMPDNGLGRVCGMICVSASTLHDIYSLPEAGTCLGVDIELFPSGEVEVVSANFDKEPAELADFLGQLGIDHLAMEDEDEGYTLVFDQDRLLGPRNLEKLEGFVVCSLVEFE